MYSVTRSIRSAYIARLLGALMRLSPALRRRWFSVRQTIEETNHPGLQRVLGADHHEARILDQVLDDVRPMPQVPYRRPNIGANRRLKQGRMIMLEVRRQQAFDGGPDQIHDGMEVTRLILNRPPELLQGRLDRTAARVSKHHHQPRAKLLGRKVDAADLRGGDNVSRNPNHEQVAQSLVEDDLDGNARIGTAKYCREWLLTRRQFNAARAAFEDVAAADIRHEAMISLAQQRQCL